MFLCLQTPELGAAAPVDQEGKRLNIVVSFDTTINGLGALNIVVSIETAVYRLGMLNIATNGYEVLSEQNYNGNIVSLCVYVANDAPPKNLKMHCFVGFLFFLPFSLSFHFLTDSHCSHLSVVSCALLSHRVPLEIRWESDWLKLAALQYSKTEICQTRQHHGTLVHTRF